MNTNRPKASQPTPETRASTTAGAVSADFQQLQQRVWVREQEIAALKVQNRHLISKLDEAMKSAEPNRIDTGKVANEISSQLRPLIAEIEKSLVESFDILKSTMRGIYQQSQRAQQAVENIGAHTRETESRANEQRKADQVYYQEKILSQVTALGDRVERQLENRLRSLAVVELMNTKQNETLADIDQLKRSISTLITSNEDLGNEVKNLKKEFALKNTSNIEKIAEMFLASEQLKRNTLDELQFHESFLTEDGGEEQAAKKEKISEQKFTLNHL